MRLNQFLARAAGGSRREADLWIRAGRVLVNGEPPRGMGAAVEPADDRVTLDGALVELPPEHRLLAYNKPRGVLVSRRSQGGRRTIFDLLGARARGLHAVGRLDIESEGLLLLSDDGMLSEALLHPRTALLRRYRVWVRPAPEVAALKHFAAGTIVEGVKFVPRRVTYEGIEGGKGILLVDLAEGKKRELRILARAAGLDVIRLQRIQFGPIHLGVLRSGAMRPLTRGEIEALRGHAFSRRSPDATLR